MATYVPGTQSYMPDWQPFTPDYKFLSDVLQIKTDRYNTNYKALNDIYGKVVYSDLSRKDTQEARNQYADTLGKKLEQLSGLDLSVSQNVDAAKQLFKPFFENDIIVKDMVFTKQYQKDMRYANSLLNSPDASQREMYWETGVKALQYQMEDFINADPNQALSMNPPRYIPDADLNQKAIDFLKASGLEVTQEYVDETGFWIVKDTNGNLITEQAYLMAQRALTDDPMVQQAYYADAYVKSRDFAAAGMQEGIFSSVDEGRAAWATETINRIETQLASRDILEQKELINLKNANVYWDEYKNSMGIIPGSDEDEKMNEVKKSYDIALLKSEYTQNLLKDATTEKGQNVDGLLNRAFNLLMGYNIQNDLSAAAITYSNMSRSRELEVNQFKKQQLQFQHDFAKMAMKFEYDKKLLELEKKPEQGSNFLSNLLGSGVTYSKEGTTSVPIDPTTGEAIDPTEADYIALSNARMETFRTKVASEQASLVVKALESLEPNANNFYTINEDIKGDLVTIKKELLKPENAGVLEDMYIQMESRLQDLNNPRNNPNFTKQNNGADVNALYNEFQNTTGKRLLVDEMITQGNTVMYENFTKALQTELVTDAVKIKNDLTAGVPKIFQNNASGALELKDEAEFIDEFLKKAESKQIKNEKDQPIGWAEQIPITYESGVYGPRAVYSGGKSGLVFNKSLATKKAKEAYDRQKSVINATLSGTLNTIAEQEGKVTEPGATIFKSWDPYQYAKGTPLSDMTPGDVLKNPYYSVSINPTQIDNNYEQAMQLSSLVTQIRQTAPQDLIYHQGDIGVKDIDDVNMKTTDPIAKSLVEALFLDLSKHTDPKASKASPLLFDIGYSPEYGPNDEDNLAKNEAAYVITLPTDFLKRHKQMIGDEEKNLENYRKITLTYPKTMDQNPRRAGEMNFSAVRSQIINSNNKQIVNNIADGGKLRIYINGDGDYIGETTIKQFDSSTGNMVNLGSRKENISQQMRARGETITYLDNFRAARLKDLQAIAIQNNRDQLSNKKTKLAK